MKFRLPGKPHRRKYEAVSLEIEELIMAKFDDLMAAIIAKHDEKAKAAADAKAALDAANAEIAALNADKEKLTADLAAAVAAAQAAPVLPADAASGTQLDSAIAAVQAL